MKILATAISAIQYNSFISLDFPAAHLFIAKQLSNWKYLCFILSKGLCQCKNLLFVGDLHQGAGSHCASHPEGE